MALDGANQISTEMDGFRGNHWMPCGQVESTSPQLFSATTLWRTISTTTFHKNPTKPLSRTTRVMSESFPVSSWYAAGPCRALPVVVSLITVSEDRTSRQYSKIYRQFCVCARGWVEWGALDDQSAHSLQQPETCVRYLESVFTSQLSGGCTSDQCQTEYPSTEAGSSYAFTRLYPEGQVFPNGYERYSALRTDRGNGMSTFQWAQE